MGVITKGKINTKYGVKDVQRALKQKFEIESIIEDAHSDTSFRLTFTVGEERRDLWVFEQYVDDDTRELVTYLSFGAWGSATKWLRGVIEYFGGYFMEEDSSGDWVYISPTDKINLSEEEILEDKIYSLLQEEGMPFIWQSKMVHIITKNLDFLKKL